MGWLQGRVGFFLFCDSTGPMMGSVFQMGIPSLCAVARVVALRLRLPEFSLVKLPRTNPTAHSPGCVSEHWPSVFVARPKVRNAPPKGTVRGGG